LLVVGLGNPGSKYAHTPHNLGFEVIDELARRWGVSKFSSKYQSDLAEHTFGSTKVWLMKPLTYMNLSGEAVQPASHFYKIPPEAVIVISDDIDLDAGVLRLRPTGGAGGHNGLKSLLQHLGTEAFPRIRIGVGRLPGIAPSDYVLMKIQPAMKDIFAKAVGLAADAVEMTVKEGFAKAMNSFNKKKEEREP